MTIQELYDFLGKFIKKHPECKDQKIMVKNLKDESTWEEVTFLSDTVVSSCPQYGSPLYFHSKTQEEVTKKYTEKMKKLEEQEDDYDYYL